MIILDGEAGAGTKDGPYQGLTLRHPSAAFTRTSSLLLPDYNTSEALHWKTAASSSEPLSKPRSRVNPQIWKAAAYAFAVYVFLSLVVILPLTIIKMKKQSNNNDGYKDPDSLWDDIETANPPSLLMLTTSGAPILEFNKTCNVWSETPSDTTAQTRFYLTPDSSVALRSNATYNPTDFMPVYGNLLVEVNPDPSEKDIVFDLGVTYSSFGLFQQTNICFSKTGSNRGLSIYTPGHFSLGDRLAFNISVLLPQVTSSVDCFITYLPMIAQTFGDLGQFTTFDRITLEGAAQPIISKYLEAQKISIKNLGSSIEGTYNVTASLVLDTIKGPVTSNITLTQLPYPTQPTLLEIATGDSQIIANVALDSSKVSGPPKSPAFGMQVNNFNGPLNMTIAYSQNTPNTTMQFTAQNNLAPTTITLDSRYQGSFCAKSKMDQIVVQTLVSSSDDPTGAQRPWILDYSMQKDGYVTGYAGWDAMPMHGHKVQGSSIDITSALSPVFLNFGSSAD